MNNSESLTTLMVDVSGHVATIRLNRPRAMNALNTVLLRELDRTLDHLNRSESVHVIVITGVGDSAFSAGADVKELAALAPSEADDAIRHGRMVMDRIETLDIPVIAAVNGYAIGGGCELALACDIRTASTNARLGFTEASLGSIPSWGGTRRLAALVGPGKAKELLYTGELVEAGDAERIGLVNRVYESSELIAQTVLMAERIARMSPMAIRMVKDVVTSTTSGQQAGHADMERLAKLLCDSSADQAEGRRAFIEKREPRFRRTL